MGLTKRNLFTEEQNTIASMAKALAHPARIAIIMHLLEARKCINSDLVQELGLAQATISQHLRELKQADIIQGTIDGNRLHYCINGKQWDHIATIFAKLFDQYHTSADCC